MTTTAHAAATLSSIAADIERIARPELVRETFHASLERAADLALAGLWFESRTVAAEAITAAAQQEGN